MKIKCLPVLALPICCHILISANVCSLVQQSTQSVSVQHFAALWCAAARWIAAKMPCVPSRTIIKYEGPEGVTEGV